MEKEIQQLVEMVVSPCGLFAFYAKPTCNQRVRLSLKRKQL